MEKNPTIVSFPVTDLEVPSWKNGEKIVEKYNLLANITHEGTSVENGSFKIHTKRNMYEKDQDTKEDKYRISEEQWFEMQDLLVEKVLAQQVMVSESYILIYEKAT